MVIPKQETIEHEGAYFLKVYDPSKFQWPRAVKEIDCQVIRNGVDALCPPRCLCPPSCGHGRRFGARCHAISSIDRFHWSTVVLDRGHKIVGGATWSTAAAEDSSQWHQRAVSR